MITPQTVLDFWFADANRAFWFRKDAAFDQTVHHRFYALWQAAAAGELNDWRETLDGRLAEIIVLDQFSRNLFRNSALAFAQDSMALVLAQEAVRQTDFADLDEGKRHFMLMPLMHSESRMIHEQAAALFLQYTPAAAYEFELKHKVIIDRFGRYPHRNAVLGRENTAQETEFLTQPDSSF